MAAKIIYCTFRNAGNKGERPNVCKKRGCIGFFLDRDIKKSGNPCKQFSEDEKEIAIRKIRQKHLLFDTSFVRHTINEWE